MKKKIVASLMILMMSFGIVAESMPRVETKAAISFLFDKKKDGAMLTTKKGTYIFVGGEKIDIDYNIGGKKKGIQGEWKSSNSKIAKVSKSGKVTALGNGEAIISFHYKSGRKKEVIKCKIISATKATKIQLVKPKGIDEIVEYGKVFRFSSVITTDSKAIKINPKIKHSYTTSYELYLDEDYQKLAPPSLATIENNGFLKVKNEAGVVYLRAIAKPLKDMKLDNLYSEAIRIEIGHRVNLKDAVIKQTSLNQFEITYEEAHKITKVELRSLKNNAEILTSLIPNQNPKLLTVNAHQNLTENLKVILISGEKTEEKTFAFSDQKVSEIEILGSEANFVSFEKGKGLAEANFRLLDQFGTDITNDFRFKDKSYALWNGNNIAEVSGNKISIPLTADQLIGYTGSLKFVYGGQEPPIEKVFDLRIGSPSEIKEVRIQGVYKRTQNGYVKAMDNTLNLPVGSSINYFGGSSVINTVPESYYLLIRVKDSKGKDIADIGAGQNKFGVTVTSGTGFELDRADNKNEVTSITPVVIDGISYLTYPVKYGILKAGNIHVKVDVRGKNLSDTMEMKVADTANLVTGSFNLNIFGEGIVGKDNLISYTLITSDNRLINKYEEVVALLGLQDYGAGIVQIPPDSKVISSANYSSFSVKKNYTSGMADLYYMPNALSLPNGMIQNAEKITIMKGSGMEKTVILIVKAK